VARRGGKYSPVNLEYREDGIVIEMSPWAGRGNFQHEVREQIFFLFLPIGQKQIPTWRPSAGRLLLSFDYLKLTFKAH